jgi:hypothetical protein
MSQLQNAIALPESKASIGERKQARIDLKNAGAALRNKWQALKGYIEIAFAADSVKTQLNVAGWSYYMMKGENWGSIKLLGEAGKKYIAFNEAKLKANNNMADSFVKEFEQTFIKFTDD